MPLAPRTEREYRLALKRLGFAASPSGQFDGLQEAVRLDPARWEHLSNSGRLMLRAAVRWAYAEAGVPEEGARLAESIKLKHEVQRLKRFPSREEVARFRDAAATLPSPDSAMLDVMLSLGLRAEEFLSLQRAEVGAALKSGALRFVRKGQKEGELPSASAADAFRVLLKRPALVKNPEPGVAAPPWDFAWQVLGFTPRAAYERMKRVVAKVAKMAECEAHWTPHMLRHAFATNMVRDGASLLIVQRALNHASFNTTAKTYIHLDTRDLEVWMNRKQG